MTKDIRLKFLQLDTWEDQMKIKSSPKKGFKLTKIQLKQWNVKYHKLILGKPTYDLIIDDKALGYDKKWAKK